MTNEQFGDSLDVDFTYASKIRNGKALPSAEVVHRIHKRYRIPYKTLMEAHATGAHAFAAVLSARIFARRAQ